ncbi:MAG: twin-arginine translocation signal domain-containing protein [Candidatus Marinimicrobia bacterium]|nr:twin-arginine translocation signal domain-containing protein [Candidatus Neomarinimicrobiota bacterium]
MCMKLNRRSFLKTTGTAAALIATPPALWSSAQNSGRQRTEEALQLLAPYADREVAELLPMQIHAPEARWHGGVVDEYQIPNASSTCWFIVRLANAYNTPYSEYYRSKEIEKPLIQAMKCLHNVQYDDGTVDLHVSNFHSPPDTGFIVNYLSPVYKVLREENPPGLRQGLNALETFLANTGKCLASGGIHTPNHRWVVCSALAWLHTFFPDRRYLDRIENWLGEGVDMDADGQYTEGSVGIYSAVCNDMFLTMGRLLDRPELFEYVRKNLDMTLYYIQPGGEVLTDASGRQDAARIQTVFRYYYAYRHFAIRDENPTYAAACRLMESHMPEQLTRYISQLLEDPIFREPLVEPTHIPDNYSRRFPHSGIFRIRRGETDISVIEQNPTFLVYMKGGSVLQSVRLHAAFFGPRGQFAAEQAVVEGDTIILKRSHTHGYFQPFPKEKRPDTGSWEEMPRDQRERTGLQTLNQTISITETDGNVTMEIEVDGTAHVPLAVEMSFRDGGELSGTIPDEFVEHSYFLKSGMGTYTVGDDTITFGPGIAEHYWSQTHMSLPKQDGQSVYITGLTPFKHTIEFS